MRLALATLALIGLAGAAWPHTTQLFREITLAGGVVQSAPETGATLLLTSVEHQCCPAGVDRVWAGMIRVAPTVTTATSEEHITLCNQCDRASALATAAGLTSTSSVLPPRPRSLRNCAGMRCWRISR